MNPSDELRAVKKEIDKVNETTDKVHEEIKRALMGTGEYADIAEEKIDKLIAQLEARLAQLEEQRKGWFEIYKYEHTRKSIF